jgi:hypothetical protein
MTRSGASRDQFRTVSAEALRAASTPARVKLHISALDPAQLLERLSECRNVGLRFGIVRSRVHENADPAHPLALLRTRQERPRRRAAEQRDEVASSDRSITSSTGVRAPSRS